MVIYYPKIMLLGNSKPHNLKQETLENFHIAGLNLGLSMSFLQLYLKP